MFDAADISKLYQMNYNYLKVNIEGISSGESLKRPEPGGNSLNWVLGHIVNSRDLILKMIDQQPVLSQSQAAPYDRGAKPEKDRDLMDLEDILSALAETQDRLVNGLNNLTEEQLRKADADREEEWQRQSLADQLVFLHFHEAYHLGQTGLLRRLTGKEGAIR